MKLRTIVIGSTLLASLVGCATETVDKDTKRAQDRMAMELSDAQSQRDQYKSQIDKLQADLTAAQKTSTDSSQDLVLLRKQVQDLQNANTALSTQVEKLKNDLSNANVAKAEK
jgi:chromosome segregation ATPase